MIQVFDPTAMGNLSAPGSSRSNGGPLFFLALVRRVHLSAPGQCQMAFFCISTSPSPPSDFWPRLWDPTDKPTSRLDCGKTVSTLTRPSTALSYTRDVLQEKSFPVSSHNLLLHITMRVMNKCCWCPLYLLLLSTFSLFD